MAPIPRHGVGKRGQCEGMGNRRWGWWGGGMGYSLVCVVRANNMPMTLRPSAFWVLCHSQKTLISASALLLATLVDRTLFFYCWTGLSVIIILIYLHIQIIQTMHFDLDAQPIYNSGDYTSDVPALSAGLFAREARPVVPWPRVGGGSSPEG